MHAITTITMPVVGNEIHLYVYVCVRENSSAIVTSGIVALGPTVTTFTLRASRAFGKVRFHPLS